MPGEPARPPHVRRRAFCEALGWAGARAGLMTVVLLPTPPFWLTTVIVFAMSWSVVVDPCLVQSPWDQIELPIAAGPAGRIAKHAVSYPFVCCHVVDPLHAGQVGDGENLVGCGRHKTFISFSPRICQRAV